ncbi:MAG TPA: hypothetical protein VF678_00300, partial [bacterium]
AICIAKVSTGSALTGFLLRSRVSDGQAGPFRYQHKQKYFLLTDKASTECNVHHPAVIVLFYEIKKPTIGVHPHLRKTAIPAKNSASISRVVTRTKLGARAFRAKRADGKISTFLQFRVASLDSLGSLAYLGRLG